jgi:hypothetical protein
MDKSETKATLSTSHRTKKNIAKKEQRNSDYLEIDAHKFSEEHLYFNDEGFNGFSDYTMLCKFFKISIFIVNVVVTN